MGATLSHLGHAPHQQSYNMRDPQQLHQGWGPIPILGNGDTASFSVIELCTRLVALEKELQISRADNSSKEAVIQYLLQSSVGNVGIKETIAQLKRQLLALKTTVDRTNEENEEIIEKLGKAEEAIIALSTPSVPTSGPQSTCTSFSSCTSPAKHGAETKDLIDLLGSNQGSDSAKLTEDVYTLLDEDYTNELDIEGVSQRAMLHRAQHQFSVSEIGGSSYLVHFADSDEDAKPQDNAPLSVDKVQVCRGLSDSITTPHQDNIRGLSEPSDDSSPESSSPRSGPISTATSFSSTSIELSPPDDVHSRAHIKDLSHLNALASDGSNLDMSTAIVSKLTDKLPSLGTYTQAEPSGPTLQASTEAQDSQTSTRGNTIEPRWSPEKTFHSAQDRENAVWINKRSAQAGARDIYYPDFFRYGIRYVPKDYEQNIYRTVAISGLSPSVTMETLLEKVRGGMLVDAKLLATAKITGSNTALVTFLYERSALEYEDHAQQHPIAFGNAFARIAVVPTPTWPMPFYLRSGIEELGHTRCFEVHNLPRDISLPAMRQVFTSSPIMKSDSLECMRLGDDGVLELRFSSIRAAAYSSALFSKTFRYQGCTVKYVPDPCAEPLETLLDRRTSETVEENTSESSYNSDAKAAADGNFGRLTKVDWDIGPGLRRGRGVKDQTNTTTDAINDLASSGILPSSVNTGEALRQETAASIASFARSFFPSK